MKDFFISYNSADRAWAEWIAWQLEAGGYEVVIQAWDFRAGGNFVLEMQRAVIDCRRTLLVLSPDFLKAQFTAAEWAAAFAQDPTGTQGLLLPVRVRECAPQGLLKAIPYIDLVGLASREQARELLLARVAQGRAKPQQEPGMPALDPGSGTPMDGGATEAHPEPPWPPALEVAADVAGSVFWRALRFLALALVAALAVLAFLRNVVPELAARKADQLYTHSVLWGLGIALAIEALLRLWRRHRARAKAGGRG